MKTQIKIWSREGNTPITGRKGSFCDLLIDQSFDCKTPEEAEKLTIKMVQETPHGAKGHYDMPEHTNQNTRNRFCGYR